MALLIFMALPSVAEKKKSSPYRHEINVSWGYSPETSVWELYDIDLRGSDGLDYIYGSYIGRKVTTGLMSVDWNVQFRRWFALGTQFNAHAILNTEVSPLKESEVNRFTDYSLSLLPYARFTYVNREYIKLYSSVGLGLSFYHDAAPDEVGYKRETDNYMGISAQFVPFGIMVGKKVYGMFELGTGTEYQGFRAGIGFRF